MRVEEEDEGAPSEYTGGQATGLVYSDEEEEDELVEQRPLKRAPDVQRRLANKPRQDDEKST